MAVASLYFCSLDEEAEAAAEEEEGQQTHSPPAVSVKKIQEQEDEFSALKQALISGLSPDPDSANGNGISQSPPGAQAVPAPAPEEEDELLASPEGPSLHPLESAAAKPSRALPPPRSKDNLESIFGGSHELADEDLEQEHVDEDDEDAHLQESFSSLQMLGGAPKGE